MTMTTVPISANNFPNDDNVQNIIERIFEMSIPVFVLLCVNFVLAVVILLFMICLIVRFHCKNQPLPSIGNVAMMLKMLSSKKEIQNQYNVIVELCGANGISASTVLKDYKQDSMQRRASVYATFGIGDAFSSTGQNAKETAYYKKLIDEYIDWDQNVYMREGRLGEAQIIEKYGMPE